MAIQQKLISGFVSDMIATWQAQTGLSIPFTSGDPLLAFWQSVATQLDFLQAQIQIVLNLARASTSTGADLDSWMAQFQFFRLQAVPGTGPETFSINAAAGVSIIIPVGTLVQTIGGAIQYEVVADSNDPTFNAAANGYVLSIGSLSISPTIQAIIPGSASNVAANVLTQFGSSLPGIASCTNPEPITNGVDAESDDAFRARFILFLATLAKATRAAILAAAMSVQQGLLIALLENQQPNGTPLLGSFTVIADDGSGNPPISLLNAVFSAVDAVRAFSVQPFVVPPTQLFVTITLSINVGPLPLPTGTSTATVNVAVQNAVATTINDLPPGGRLNGSAIIAAALAVPFVAAVNPSSVTINGGTADLIPTIQQEVRVTVLSIAVQNYRDSAVPATTIVGIDGPQFAARLAQLFPRGWAGADAVQTGNVYSLLLSIGNELQITQEEIQYALDAQRLQTETSPELDDASLDFYGGALPRGASQSDANFALEITADLFQPTATRTALFNALAALTGLAPRMMEPWNVYDTGSWRNKSYWNVDTVANPARWGNGGLRYQGYIETAPPGIPAIGANNPILAWKDSAYWNVPGYFFGIIQPVDENAINDLINRLRAYGTIVWVKLVSPSTLGTVTAPGVVTGLTAVVAGPTSANISWNAPSGTPPFTYQVLYRVTGTTTFSAAPTGTTNTVTLTGLASNTSYDVAVIARNLSGFSETPTITVSTSIVPPSPVQNLQATLVQATAITVTWTPPLTGTQPFNYSVQYFVAGTSNVQSLAVTQGATAITILGLLPSTTYDIEVIASNVGI